MTSNYYELTDNFIKGYLDKLLFNLSIDIALECVEINVDYSGYNIYQVGDPKANTEQLCQQSCVHHPDCDWWSLDLITWNKYGCWLKSKKSIENKESRIGTTFGPKFCGK